VILTYSVEKVRAAIYRDRPDRLRFGKRPSIVTERESQPWEGGGGGGGKKRYISVRAVLCTPNQGSDRLKQICVTSS
jgi:hypothetical protein